MDPRDTYPPSDWSTVLLPTTTPDEWAKQRISLNHEAFPQPDSKSHVWRYMDLPRFLSFLSTRSLFFTRADLLEQEGYFPKGSEATFRAFIEKARMGGAEAAAKDWETALRESYERNRWSVFMSCWIGKPNEDKQMWKNYAGSSGVAIRSTYERLNASLPLAWRSQAVLLGKVSYGDYASLDYVKDVSNHLNIFMSKPLEYEGECEVRAVINDFRLTKEQASPGLTVAILPHTLVERVVTAPGSPPWFVDAVSAACRAFKLDVPVEVSALDRLVEMPF
ncbi:MAG TPA: hypothetical protein VHU44_09005 [Acidobacteriaceae bacterium]|jgi:hypothetical protein|nr:hypothetical protein [Acidobacteriaceae bacterium]